MPQPMDLILFAVCVPLFTEVLPLFESIAKVQNGVDVPDNGRLLHVVKGDAVGSAAFLLEFGRPQRVVRFVPVALSIRGRLPRVVTTRRKGVEALPVLVVPGVDQVNVKHVLEAARDKHVFHRRVFVGETPLIVQTGLYKFLDSGPGQRVTGTARIEKDVAVLALLESTSPKKVFPGWILDGVGKVASQVLRQNVQIFSSLKEEIKVVQVVGANKSPNRSNLLPHVVVFFSPVVRERNCRQSRIVPSRKGQKSIAAGSPGFSNGANVCVMVFLHGVHHAQDFGCPFHLFGGIIDAPAKHIHSANRYGIQGHNVLVGSAARDPNLLAQFLVRLGHQGRRPGISVLVFSGFEHPPEDRHVGNPFDGLGFFVVVFRISVGIRCESRTGRGLPKVVYGIPAF
mmetsp:Transcript_7883/g.23185  ORF Transcript_7883/g.23185 Transcript_7883/m.23185 type:complete len:398 (-) Transcript_7883:578-1771(-)